MRKIDEKAALSQLLFFVAFVFATLIVFEISEAWKERTRDTRHQESVEREVERLRVIDEAKQRFEKEKEGKK